MKSWQTPQLELYYAERRRDVGDRPVSIRPSADHEWIDGEGWSLNLSRARSGASFAVDDKAETVRLRYITPGAGQAGTYLIKERQAEAYAAANFTGTVPAMVQAEVDATGMTSEQACEFILAQRDFWLVKAADIERVRRTAKVLIDAADTQTAIEAARDTALVALEDL